MKKTLLVLACVLASPSLWAACGTLTAGKPDPGERPFFFLEDQSKSVFFLVEGVDDGITAQLNSKIGQDVCVKGSVAEGAFGYELDVVEVSDRK